jgi:hypothetical protein
MLTLNKGYNYLENPHTYFLPLTREQLFSFLPSNCVTAEIGVLGGGFSQFIWQTNMPQHLHLVDLWESQEDEKYQKDPSNATPLIQNQRYHEVCSRFRDQINAGVIHIHRGYSHIIAEQFKDNYFDWLFVDANHTYEAVLQDLRSYGPKVSDHGLIVGHDFTNHSYAKECHFGVVEAVRDFCEESGAILIAVTSIEEFPTYVLAKRPDSLAAINFLGSLFHEVKGIVEVRNYFDRYFRHKTFEFSDSRKNHVFSI